MKIPRDRKYSETHEWFLVDDDTVTIGVTQYAADELTDITYIELPEVGAVLSAGDKMGEVESVKATSEILTSVSGEVIEVNAALVDHPELVNDDAFDEGWMVRLRPESTDPLAALLGAKEYEVFISSAG